MRLKRQWGWGGMGGYGMGGWGSPWGGYGGGWGRPWGGWGGGWGKWKKADMYKQNSGLQNCRKAMGRIWMGTINTHTWNKDGWMNLNGIYHYKS
jgi:hypothetical protein